MFHLFLKRIVFVIFKSSVTINLRLFPEFLTKKMFSVLYFSNTKLFLNLYRKQRFVYVSNNEIKAENVQSYGTCVSSHQL